MKQCLFILALLMAPLCATAAVPIDLVAAMNAVEADRAAVAAAQTAFTTAQAALSSGTAALAISVQAEHALHDKYYPPVNPTPGPVGHTVGLVMVGGAGCPPCKRMEPILAQLAKEGLTVSNLDAETTGLVWKVSATPTFISTVDGVEANRSVGTLTHDQIKGWYALTKEWAAKKYPKEPIL